MKKLKKKQINFKIKLNFFKFNLIKQLKNNPKK